VGTVGRFPNARFVRDILRNGTGETGTAISHMLDLPGQPAPPPIVPVSLRSPTWRFCAWHSVADKLSTGYVPRADQDNPGLEVYEFCRGYGAIVVNGHDHTYSRTRPLSLYQGLSVAPIDMEYPPRNNHGTEQVLLRQGVGMSLVVGLGGQDIRSSKPGADTWAHWARTYNSRTDRDASFGALFCVFNPGGHSPKRAECAVKTIDNRIIDRFDLISAMGAADLAPAGGAGKRKHSEL